MFGVPAGGRGDVMGRGGGRRRLLLRRGGGGGGRGWGGGGVWGGGEEKCEGRGEGGEGGLVLV